MTNVCRIPGCEGKYNAKGLCGAHYSTWRRHGDPLIRVKVVRPCIVDGCESPRRGHGYCSLHYTRWRTHGNTTTVLPSVRPSGPASWTTDQITYLGAHQRVYRTYGKASAHTCPCGKIARQWAYNYLDPNEWTQAPSDGRQRLLRYSGDPKYYVAMCGTCHHNHDKAHRDAVS